MVPHQEGSVALENVPEPTGSSGSVLVETLAVGICGTDAEIVGGQYGWAPPGRERLILGHESIGRVVDPGSSSLAKGEHVVGIVRRPDPVPCPSCAAGEWDMCSNGQYTEHGIKELDGFMAERWRIEPENVVPVDERLGVFGVLLEPTTVVAKAWEQILAIGRRAFWQPRQVMVLGAGPIGLLGALIGVQRGFEVHVFDRVTEGRKPELVRELGAHYHAEGIQDSGIQPDVVLECAGVPELILRALLAAAPGAVVCLTGVGPPMARSGAWDISLATHTVLNNLVVFGSVNANRRHYRQAADILAAADRQWLEALITRRVAPDAIADAFTRGPDDVKTIVEFAASSTS